MLVNIHRPEVSKVVSLGLDRGDPFHVISLSDGGGCKLDMFIDPDWQGWDAIVAAVEKYRGEV